jgi:hypothetical protein
LEAIIQALYEVQHPKLNYIVEGARRFICNQQSGLADKSLCDYHSLSLSTAQLVRIRGVCLPVWQPNRLQNSLYFIPALPLL